MSSKESKSIKKPIKSKSPLLSKNRNQVRKPQKKPLLKRKVLLPFRDRRRGGPVFDNGGPRDFMPNDWDRHSEPLLPVDPLMFDPLIRDHNVLPGDRDIGPYRMADPLLQTPLNHSSSLLPTPMTATLMNEVRQYNDDIRHLSNEVRRFEEEIRQYERPHSEFRDSPSAIYFSRCILYPPHPEDRPPVIQQKPPFCKTIFVGNLPERVEDDIIVEVFSSCGSIRDYRPNQKRFCHIRFRETAAVDKAIALSGYYMSINDIPDTGYTSKLHIDYAKEEKEAAERREKEKSSKELSARKDLSEIPHFSEKNMLEVASKLKSDDTFLAALPAVIDWMKKGMCNKKNVGTFYSMLQSISCHVRKMESQKHEVEEQIRLLKEKLTMIAEQNLQVYTDIEQVFSAAEVQKVWDVFTKAQRKNLEMWKNYAVKVKESNMQNLIRDDNIELSTSTNEKVLSTDVQSSNAEKDAKQEFPELEKKLEASQRYCKVLLDDYKELKDKYEAQQILLEKTIKTEDSKASVSATFVPSSLTADESRMVSLISIFLNAHLNRIGVGIDYISSYLEQIDSRITSRDVENILRKFTGIFKEEKHGVGANMSKKWTLII